MFNLNSYEKTVIVFLTSAILVGSLIHHYNIKNISSNEYVQNIIEEKSFSPSFININTAEQKELILLDGIGPVLAERIISYRNTRGPFISKEDIMNVKGIGPRKYDKIKDFIIVK